MTTEEAIQAYRTEKQRRVERDQPSLAEAKARFKALTDATDVKQRRSSTNPQKANG
jgi:hypothetical protein